MKITLVQLDAGTDWSFEDLPQWLEQVPRADLVVFPECYPFWRESGISHDTAMKRLEKSASMFPEVTFIAGGYVYDKGTDGATILRNRSYLVHRCFVTDFYDKQIAFQGESFTQSNIVKLFTWNKHQCLPLICADADQGPDSLFMANLIKRAKAAGVGPDVPIVVSSYGAMLMQPYWTDSLHHLANQCESPVLICGIAGKSAGKFIYTEEDGGDGKAHFYGGGGSGLFMPNDLKPLQYVEPGYITVDLSNIKSRFKSFAQKGKSNECL